MRIAAYLAAIPSFLVWAAATVTGYQYALTAFGVEFPGCCHGPPSQLAGILAVILPLTVLAVFVWIVFSRLVATRPGLALIVFLASLPVGVIFAFTTALEVTPL
jgi:hypothetical protein